MMERKQHWLSCHDPWPLGSWLSTGVRYLDRKHNWLRLQQQLTSAERDHLPGRLSLWSVWASHKQSMTSQSLSSQSTCP